eukprot:30811-Pelagococcus_subviridis.AAC.8
MHATPQRIARSIASSVYACAHAYIPAFLASSTMHLSSSSENCKFSSRSVGLDTPPLAIILMCFAPFLTSSRTAARHASTPSQTRPIVKLQHEHAPDASATSPAPRKSPCPPVCESAFPQ